MNPTREPSASSTLRPMNISSFAANAAGLFEYMRSVLQRRHRLPSTTLVYDLQFRLRCQQCRADRGFEIAVEDSRDRHDPSKPLIRRVIVPKES